MSIAVAFLLTIVSPHVLGQALPGDVDGSGQVDASDVQMVVDVVLGRDSVCVCDVAGSEGVDAVDVQFVVNAAAGQTPPPVYSYEVINQYPHDPGAFTQGLVFHGGVLYEGTGLKGQSSLRKVALETGEVVKKRDLSYRYFGEGVTVLGDEIMQLTWRSHVGFVYDRDTFERLRDFSYPSEGWGLTHDGLNLIMSDGTAMLRFLAPATFEEVAQLEVRDGEGPVRRLNELEYIGGEIYANVWQTDRIARISPRSGRVVGWIDLTGLLKPEDRTGSEGVLNGIAYDAAGKRLFVTGKRWPKLFEIRLVAGG